MHWGKLSGHNGNKLPLKNIHRECYKVRNLEYFIYLFSFVPLTFSSTFETTTLYEFGF